MFLTITLHLFSRRFYAKHRTKCANHALLLENSMEGILHTLPIAH
uniref:Uncharacterized protein n=1 Tax=Anguilla anguilla TaxID=7936 RepID=A0A0E9VZ90_ANGAN